MEATKKEIEISFGQIKAFAYGIILSYVLIVITHLFQEKWNVYNPMNIDYWFIYCPFNDDITHKGNSKYIGAIASPFTHYILWIALTVVLILLIRFFQTTKIKIKESPKEITSEN